MRFIIREQDYETLIASGKYLQRNKDGSIGGSEYWRWTEAIDGYSFLRVDVDFRETTSDSTLFHITVDSTGHIARLNFRFYGAKEKIVGDIVVGKGESILNLRTDGSHHQEQRISHDSNNRVWFPTLTGLGLLVRLAGDRTSLPSTVLDMAQGFTLKNVNVHLSWKSEVEMVTARERILVRPCLIQWSNQRATIWFDEFDLPVKMIRNNDIEVIEYQYVRHMKYG